MTVTQIKIPIPKTVKTEDLEDLGHDIVEFIRQRTESGKDKDGGRFPGYSKGYKKSLDFKIAGKSNKVNLTLSGDMLQALDVIATKPGEIKIGYEKGSREADRAEGNILGSYGGEAKKSRARDFLGISDKDLAKILKNYESSGG
jgi:hypothetical protein